jgi:hypothetical protein
MTWAAEADPGASAGAEGASSLASPCHDAQSLQSHLLLRVAQVPIQRSDTDKETPGMRAGTVRAQKARRRGPSAISHDRVCTYCRGTDNAFVTTTTQEIPDTDTSNLRLFVDDRSCIVNREFARRRDAHPEHAPAPVKLCQVRRPAAGW